MEKTQITIRLTPEHLTQLQSVKELLSKSTYSKTILHLVYLFPLQLDEHKQMMLELADLRARLKTAQDALISIDAGLVVARSVSESSSTLAY